MFRLHIDIPLGHNPDEAENVAKWFMSLVESLPELKESNTSIQQINYRLGHDEDRQKSNYLIKTESGHVTKQKNVIDLT